MAFKIDIAKLEELLKYNPEQDPTSNVPSFADYSDAETQRTNDKGEPEKVSTETRLLNHDVQINNIYKLIQRMADEVRNTHESIREVAHRVKNPKGM